MSESSATIFARKIAPKPYDIMLSRISGPTRAELSWYMPVMIRPTIEAPASIPNRCVTTPVTWRRSRSSVISQVDGITA